MTTPTPTITVGSDTPIFSASAPISPEATTDPGELLHMPPTPGRTQYLPVSGDGGIDGQPGEAAGVNEMDSRVDALNAATLDYDPAHLYSFDDVRCEAGCGDTPDSVVSLSDDDALAGVTSAFQSLVTIADDVKGVIANYSGEMWVERLDEIYSGTGTFNPDTVGDDTEAVYSALVAALEASEAAGNDALGALRITVQALRSSIAERAERRVNAVDWALSVPLGLTGIGAAWSVASVGMNVYDLWKGGHARDAGLDAISAAEPMLAEAMAANDQAVAALRSAVSNWQVKVNKNAVRDLPKSDAPKPAEAPVADAIRDPGPASTGAPLSAPAEGDSESADPLQSALDELLGSDPMAGMPQMGGMPAGGGMPSMGGGMPSDMGSGMGTPLSDPMATEELAKPLDDLAGDDEEELEEPLDDLSDSEGEDTDDVLTDPGEITPDELPEIGDEDDADEAVDEELPEDGETPVEPEAEIDPNSEEARTADVGNGRKVTFPTAALAGLGEGLAAPGNENKTLRLLASELGFQIPPDGQDIGKQVPTSLLREGDVLVGAAGEGIFIGTDEVLMEGGKIVPLSEAAVFDGQNQGIFRLDEGGGGTAAPATDTVETGLAQPIGDGSTSPLSGTDPAVDATPTVSTPGDVTAQSGTPGVPTDDAEEVGDTSASATAFGDTDNGAGGLNPDDVFPS